MSTRSAARLVWQCPLGTITNTIDVASARIIDTRHEDFVCREMLADPRPYRSNRCGRCRTQCSLRKQHSRVAGEFDRPSGLDRRLERCQRSSRIGLKQSNGQRSCIWAEAFRTSPISEGRSRRPMGVAQRISSCHRSSLRNGIDYEAPDHAFDYQEGS